MLTSLIISHTAAIGFKIEKNYDHNRTLNVIYANYCHLLIKELLFTRTLGVFKWKLFDDCTEMYLRSVWFPFQS